MPYISLASLPSWVRKMPVGAQKIWRATFNSAIKRGATEEVAFKIAISQVKVKYRFVGGKWVKKQMGTPDFVQGAILSRENLPPNKPKKKPKKL